MHDLSWLTARPIAHRGLHDMNKSRWENTLSAFAAAADRGYAIECDVHLSSDGIPVIFHDGPLKRLLGQEGNIWERTAVELSACPVGGTADCVPSLETVLKLIDGRVPVIIELKGTKGYDEGLVEKVAGVLAHYHGKAAIMSFDHWLIREFPKHAPDVPGGLTAYGTSDADIEGHFSMLAHDIAFVSYSVTDLPNRFVTFVRERLGMPVVTWTVRDPAAVKTTFDHADQMTFEGFEP
ncbi:MAG TPA: glycerophosphodiester phosphodiesterase [Rhizobiaceae bacterium]|nr:glycerophosphodiester phosphodiesterase [Rhizobiaceae bacterium]